MNRRRGRRHGLLWRAAALVLAMLLLVVAADRRLRPAVQEYAVNQARQRVSEAMAAAVQAVLRDGAYDYAALTTVARGADGAVLSVETDAMAVNSLTAQVGEALNRSMRQSAYSTLKIPLLNATGSVFLMGRGPRVTVKIQQSGAATVNLNSSFFSAGINQTAHRLELTLSFYAVVLAAGAREPIAIESRFLVAETVIVGAVPEVFANITQ